MNIMKKLFSIISMMFVIGIVSAQNVNFYTTPTEFKVKPGEQFTIPISLKNDIDITGCELHLFLPDGVSVAKNERGRYIYSFPRQDEHITTFIPDAVTDKNEQFLLIGMSGKYPLLDNDGEVVNITFNVDENITLGEKAIKITDILLNHVDENNVDENNSITEIYLDDINIPLTVYQNFNISATTANESMGSVTIDGAGEEVESGTTITATATPVAGYEFVNWTAGEEVVSTENPYKFEASANVALVANFQAKKFPVSFVIDGKATTENLSFGSTVTTPENPTKEGYTFTGWEPEFVEGVTVPVDGLTYTATWKVNQYTITFDTDGGSEIAALTQDFGTAITTPAVPTKTGYTFTGWTPEIPATMPAKNQTIKATWKINQYAVIFNIDGKENQTSLNYGAVIPTPESPSKEGYTFTGWEPEFKEGATVPENGITYTATWKINQYTVTFDTDGGTEIAPITQDYGTKITAPAAPTKTGYSFAGWDAEIPATMPAKNQTIKATWTINQYNVVFVVDGEEVSNTTQDYGTVISAPSAPEKVGYTFTGWDPEFKEGATVPENDITYKATWKVNQYTITFDTDGGTEMAAITQDYGTKITAPAAPTKTGYSFAGWDAEIPATMPAKDMTIKASWTINQYDVVFIVDGETVSKSTQDYGTVITAPEVPVKEGHTFAGWNPAFKEGDTVPEGGITYEAVWKGVPYTITFDTDGGTEIAAITQDYGTEITVPANPTKTGYSFVGWDVEIPETMPAKDMIIKAIWKINQYDVVFIVDGEVISKSTQDYGTVITAPENPTKPDYNFIGWDPEYKEGATVPEGGVTYTAQWAANEVTITFDSNGGSEVPSITQKPGTPVTAPADPTREGYIFMGWSEDVPTTMPDKDITLVAQWQFDDTEVKAKFTTYLSNIVIVDYSSEADETIMQENIPYDYAEIKQAFEEAQNDLYTLNGEALLAAFNNAKQKLGVYYDYCCEIGNPRSYEYTLTEEWGTIILPFKYSAPEDWTVYNVTGLDLNGTTLQLSEAETIEANKPYLVKGTPGKKIQFIGHADSNVKNITNGLLTGVQGEDYTPKNGEYVLQSQNGVVGFYRVNNAVATPVVKATRCYLTLPETAAKVKAFYLGEGTTGITAPDAMTGEEQKIFNLSGQRMNRTTRGINIVNGKKVLVK